MTTTIDDPRSLREACNGLRASGARVGFVPTMGALHAGHLSLIDAAAAHGAKHTVVSIFVNPLQFGANEDLDKYPRTFQRDLAACAERGVEYVYAPNAAAMYPPGFQTHVEVEGIAGELEGAFRPTHFRGVTTVVAKLFNAVGPCVALFGRKDYQQWRVLAAMARDLDLPVEVVGCPTCREPDGLAMSSRNRYLGAQERQKATALHRGLRAANDAFVAGERDPATLEHIARAPVDVAFDRVDYIALRDAETLARFDGRVSNRAVMLMAAHLGATRLIDNSVLGEEI